MTVEEIVLGLTACVLAWVAAAVAVAGIVTAFVWSLAAWVFTFGFVDCHPAMRTLAAMTVTLEVMAAALMWVGG